MGAVTFFWMDQYVTCENLKADGWVTGRSRSGKLGDLGIPFSRIDAALKDPRRGRNQVYLFSGTSYVILDLGLKRCADQDPLPVSTLGIGSGRKLDAFVKVRVDAAINKPDSGDMSYFFVDGQYARYEWPNDWVEPGRPITDGWSLPEAFRGADLRGGVNAAAGPARLGFFFVGRSFGRLAWAPEPKGAWWGTGTVRSLRVRFNDGTSLDEVDAVVDGWVGPDLAVVVPVAPSLPAVVELPTVVLFHKRGPGSKFVFPVLLDEAFDPLGNPSAAPGLDAALRARYVGTTRQSELMRQGLGTADNWVDLDSRSFRIAVKDPAARGQASVKIRWECFRKGGEKINRPEPDGIIEPFPHATYPAVFYSPALALTSVDYHVGTDVKYALLTTRGASFTGPGPAGFLGPSDPGYRLRLFSILGTMVVEYPVGSGRITRWGSFPTTGDPAIRLKRLELTLWAIWNPALAAAHQKAPDEMARWILGPELRHIRGVFDRLGIAVTVATPAAPLPAGGFDVVIDGDCVRFAPPPPGYLTGVVVTDRDAAGRDNGELVLGPMRPIVHAGGADADKIAIVYGRSFSSGAGGWGGDANANLLAVAMGNFGFGPYGTAITHEMGHCLTVQDQARMSDADPVRRTHYPRDRTSPRDERLHLVAAGSVTAAVAGTLLNLECVWDANDSRGYNWYTGMRSSGLLK